MGEKLWGERRDRGRWAMSIGGGVVDRAVASAQLSLTATSRGTPL